VRYTKVSLTMNQITSDSGISNTLYSAKRQNGRWQVLISTRRSLPHLLASAILNNTGIRIGLEYAAHEKLCNSTLNTLSGDSLEVIAQDLFNKLSESVNGHFETLGSNFGGVLRVLSEPLVDALINQLYTEYR
jgi:hypothetical protein